MKKAAGVLVLSVLPFLSLSSLPFTAHAAAADWLKGFNVVPTSTTDFGSASFDQSLKNMRNAGANSVAFVIPYYQSNTGSTDVQAGWNTPTDAALASAIDYAHSLGLSVTLKPHIDPYSGEWRAYINPGDRDAWFNAYDAKILHLAELGQAHHVELIVMGTELVSMAASNMNSTNTSHWLSLIGQIRKVYGGKLTYGANSTGNNPSDTFSDEKAHIGFWSSLDYAGLSAYYGLQGDGSVGSIENDWGYWNDSDLKQFATNVGKPIIFTELGYRSVDNAHSSPWDWYSGGNYNPQEQSNLYQGLMQYWNDYSYFGGIYWWNWSTDPNAGGAGNTDYTPQNKPVMSVISQWFGNPPAPPPPTPSGNPALALSGSASPASLSVGAQDALVATVKNTGDAVNNGIVDIEIYNSADQKIFQQYSENQTIGSGQSRQFGASWKPSAAGTYHMTVGVFTSGWAKNLGWNNDAADITVTSGSPPPPPAGYTTDVWWPSDGAHVSGVQPFKAMLEQLPVSDYQMYWQVDGGPLVLMNDSTQDYPHKEAAVDLSNWHWNGSGPYTITFVSKKNGATIASKSIKIYIP